MTGIKHRWIDRWLCSDAEELLEREGATTQGVKIIDELNDVYRRTGLTNRLAKAITGKAAEIHTATGNPVKILEIGMRDGALLRAIEKTADASTIPLELHGVEFRSDIKNLAAMRFASNHSSVHAHHDMSKALRDFKSDNFDLVYSTFVLHHQTLDELRQLLQASFRVSRNVVVHLDLERSAWRLVLLWIYYTLFRYRTSRADAVLSFRRAFRRTEISGILHELEAGGETQVKAVFPLYWAVCRSFGACKL